MNNYHYILNRVYEEGYYTSIILPLLLIPSWALAIDPFLGPLQNNASALR